MAFLDGIDDLLYTRELGRHYEWLLSLAEDAEQSPAAQSATNARQGTSVGVTVPQQAREAMTVSTGATG
jgi:hypothetical protein